MSYDLLMSGTRAFVSLILVLIAIPVSAAKYDLDVSRGIYTQSFDSPYKGVKEICVMPKHLVEVKYKDTDFEEEAMLCSLDFYGNTTLNGVPLKHVAICPKNKSTNPAVEIYEIKKKELSIAQFEKQQCRLPSGKRDKKKAKRLAKYKQSISCSYTPSILAYYHMSRLLGGVGDVEPAVIRTMSVKKHRKLAKLGLRNAKRYKQGLIEDTWRMYVEAENNIDKRSNRYARRYSHLLFSTDNKQIFGAMQKDVKKEERYREFYIKRGKSGYKKFKSHALVKRLTSKKSYADATPTLLYQLKDFSDMLVIDYLLSQEDRYANVSYKDYYYWIDKQGEIKRKRIPKKKGNQLSDGYIQENNIHTVRRLILKDNDCGVNRINKTKKSRVLSRIRHMSLDTYQRLLWLETKIESDDTKQFFQNELLFSKKDWSNFASLVSELKGKLQKRCRSGSLKLDLNPESALRGVAYQSDKEHCELPSWGDLIRN